MNVNWTRITPVCVPPVTYSFTNRTVLPSSSLTQFCSSLPVRPSQQDWAPTKLFHRLDSTSSSLRLVFPGVTKCFYHQCPQKDSDVPYKWSIPCLFCSVSGQNVGEFLIFKYETISLPSVQMCLFPSLDRCMALRQHRGSCSQARWRIWWKMFSKAETLWFSLMESQMLGRPLHSSVCGSPSCPEVHHFLCQGKLLCSFVWKPSDWCHLVVDQCNSNKHSWLWVHCLQHWISSSCCLEPVLMNSIL